MAIAPDLRVPVYVPWNRTTRVRWRYFFQTLISRDVQSHAMNTASKGFSSRSNCLICNAADCRVGVDSLRYRTKSPRRKWTHKKFPPVASRCSRSFRQSVGRLESQWSFKTVLRKVSAIFIKFLLNRIDLRTCQNALPPQWSCKAVSALRKATE